MISSKIHSLSIGKYYKDVPYGFFISITDNYLLLATSVD